MKDNDKAKMDDVFRVKRDKKPKPVGHNTGRSNFNSELESKLRANNSVTKRYENEVESQSSSKQSFKKKPNIKWKKAAIIAGCVVVLALVGWSVYSYVQLNKIQNPEYVEQQSQQEAESLANKVGRLMELPEGEPVVATVSDKDKLVDQPFFDKAENGDKVLIYSESSTAIIYRESENKIINSGPIAISSDEAINDETSAEAGL